jgi:hypothetical protein
MRSYSFLSGLIRTTRFKRLAAQPLYHTALRFTSKTTEDQLVTATLVLIAAMLLGSLLLTNDMWKKTIAKSNEAVLKRSLSSTVQAQPRNKPVGKIMYCANLEKCQLELHLHVGQCCNSSHALQ